MKSNFIILLFILFSVYSKSQEFTATISKTPVTVGERFQITFSVNAEGSNFKAPDFKGFSVLSGPSQSQNIQIINGAMSRSLSFSFLLSADKIGDYTINPAYISCDGKQLKSNSVQIKVLPESDAQKQQRQQEAEHEKSLGDQATKILKDNIFVRLNISKKDVFQGEQVTATYKLFIHPELNIVQLNPSKIPSFNGFWAQELNTDKISWQREIVNGIPYNSAVIKQVVLFPQRSGKLTIDPYEFDVIARLKVQTRRRSNDPFSSFFDDPFFGGSYRDFPYKPKSETYTINVKPLPSSAPSSFEGAVGSLSLDAWLDKNNVKAGEPITLKVKISGKGNLKLIQQLKVNFPPDFELYDPKTIDNISISAGGATGNISFEYLAIPRNAGKFKIEPIEFSYFDLSKNAFTTVKSTEFDITVDKNENQQLVNNVVTGIRKEEVQLIGKDIRFIKLNINDFEKNRTSLLFSNLFWLFVLLPFILFFIIIFWLRKRRNLHADISLFKNKRATKVSSKRLSIAKKYMIKLEYDKFYEEINKALWGYVSDKLFMPYAELTKDKTRETLNSKGVDETIINEFLDTLDAAEFARYAPGDAKEGMDNIYRLAVKVITDLEGTLK